LHVAIGAEKLGMAIAKNASRKVSVIAIKRRNKDVEEIKISCSLEEMKKHIGKPYRAMTNIAIEQQSLVACYPPKQAVA